jgi:hypothetical protein
VLRTISFLDRRDYDVPVDSDVGLHVPQLLVDTTPGYLWPHMLVQRPPSPSILNVDRPRSRGVPFNSIVGDLSMPLSRGTLKLLLPLSGSHCPSALRHDGGLD